MKNEDDKILPLAKVDKIYEDYFNELSKLDDNDIIVKSNCKFCSHPIRFEAERRFEETGSWVCVQKVFDEYNKSNPSAPKMNFQNIRAHILNHYNAQQKKIWLKEYSENLLGLMNKRIKDEHRVHLLSQQMQMKLFEIAADPTICPLKAADAMSKLAKATADLILVHAKLKGELQTVNVFVENLTNVFSKVISRQEDPGIRQMLISSLDEVQSHLDGISLTVDEDE